MSWYSSATTAIPISSRKYPGLVALVDDEDYERVAARRWFVHRPDHTFYAYAGARTPDGRRTTILLHRFVLNLPIGVRVDHKNGDGLDCRRMNLRIATQQQNLFNRRTHRTNKSGYKGVHRTGGHKRRPWQSMITFNGKQVYLGSFDDPIEAARVYDTKARELFGDFAWLNFPEQEVDDHVISSD